MTDTQTVETMGPVSYLIVEFPGGRMTGEGLPVLLDLVDRGLIRVLDLEFLAKDLDGGVRAVQLADLDGDGKLDLSAFEGVSSGLVDESDMAEAASAIDPGSAAGILIFENRWAAQLAHALRRGGAQLVAAGFIPLDTLVASLDAAEKSGV